MARLAKLLPEYLENSPKACEHDNETVVSNAERHQIISCIKISNSLHHQLFYWFTLLDSPWFKNGRANGLINLTGNGAVNVFKFSSNNHKRQTRIILT